MEATEFERGTSRILVAVRIRPEKKPTNNSSPENQDKNNRYGAMYQKSIVRKLDAQNILLTDPLTLALPPLATSLELKFRQNHSRDKVFSFDRVFTAEDSQREVFKGAALEKLVDDVVSGVNGTVFAYGPTGAGKTYTMMGNEQDPGMTILLLTALFDKIVQEPSEEIELQCIYLEIYNETIRDLLSTSTPEVELRTDQNNVPTTPGATRIPLSSLSQSIGLLRTGNSRRSTEPTLANAVSSRSHAIFSVIVSSRTTQAKLSMVDLAGSERAAGTGNRGARMIEGAAINRSLLALGNCINKLAGVEDDGAKVRKGKKERGYVNYRDSKLTRILSDSLGGNCRTIMIAACSPGSTSFEETCNTLKYAARARSITNATAPIPRIWDADGTRRLFDDEEIPVIPIALEKITRTTSSEDLLALFDRIVKVQAQLLIQAGVADDSATKQMIEQAAKMKSLLDFKKKTHRRLKSKALSSSKSSASLAIPDGKNAESAFELIPRQRITDRTYHHKISNEPMKQVEKLPAIAQQSSKVALPYLESYNEMKRAPDDTFNTEGLKPARQAEPDDVQVQTSLPTALKPSQPRESKYMQSRNMAISIPRHVSIRAISDHIEIPSPLFGPEDDSMLMTLSKVDETPPNAKNYTTEVAKKDISSSSRSNLATGRARSHTDEESLGVFRRIKKVFQPKLTRVASHPIPSNARKPAHVSINNTQLFDPKLEETIRAEQMKKAYGPAHSKPARPKIIKVK